MGWITAFDKLDSYEFPGRCMPPLQTAAAMAETMLDHLSALQVDSPASSVCLCGIVCTIGVASGEVDKIEELIESGMNVACLNFKHGTLEYHGEILQNIRAAARNYNTKIGINSSLGVAVMTRGAMIHVYPAGDCCSEITLYEGDVIEVSADFEYIIKTNDPNSLYINFDNLRNIAIGREIIIDDARLVLVTIGIADPVVSCRIVKGGDVKSGNRVHLPGTVLDKPNLTERDKLALRFAVENDIDVVFAAAIRTADAVDEIRAFLGPEGADVMIVSQIEDRQGLENVDEIIARSDGVMIGRNALGNDIDQAAVFLAQKSVISKCNVLGKPVLCTAHMLKSMVWKPLPTSAESCDVADAVLDGADCIWLNHETSIGDHAATCIKKAVSICKQAAAAVWQKQIVTDLSNKITPPVITIHAVAAAAVQISFRLLASAIVVVSSSMKSAHLLTQYHPKCPVIAVTRNAKRARQAHMYRGILPVLYKDEREADWHKDLELRAYFGIKFGRKNGFIRPGDPIVVMTCSQQASGFADQMQVMYVSRNILHGTRCLC